MTIEDQISLSSTEENQANLKSDLANLVVKKKCAHKKVIKNVENFRDS